MPTEVTICLGLRQSMGYCAALLRILRIPEFSRFDTILAGETDRQVHGTKK